MNTNLLTTTCTDIIALHASAAYTNNGALLFLGPSGTGKTTICKLLDKHMQTLAWDAVYLVYQGNIGWKVLKGDGYAHKKLGSWEKITTQPSLPLQAIVRLYQAQFPHIEKIEALQTCRHLVDSLFEITRHRDESFEVKRQAFSKLATIARSVPGYRLDFDLSMQTLYTLNNTVHVW